ncbi:hypothetical protein PR003_g8534 [Phytophthora rubi]|uniref:Uncharacterized protein n=1 Tax=Phytophthora rubi TaxID=129364 RepID=A0A6A3N4G1_9STRA|nr:hypothetical protein PR002_g8262 [Phytophthora rubi]KAE9038555.1 hypothetical protein PR001_g7901 [Phytophthora rubi]KAE9344293.1 hypothetical protein PR003_g8534 [Phytophthora rubi]
MSVRREVVTLSQLLRRNDNSSSRRGAGRAPPLPLQRSRRQSNSTPFTGTPATPRQQPLSFTQQLRDANRISSSQPEVGASSQTSSAALSQEVYDPEGEQLSAMTSMSQSSFSQTQSQNLLGSSQDDHLHRLQQWQAQHAPSPVLPPPAHSEKLQELEKNLTQAFIEQTYQQKQQQQEVMKLFARPIQKSVEEVKGKLATTSDDLKQQRTSLAELADGVKGVAKSVTDLRQQVSESLAALVWLD